LLQVFLASWELVEETLGNECIRRPDEVTRVYEAGEIVEIGKLLFERAVESVQILEETDVIEVERSKQQDDALARPKLLSKALVELLRWIVLRQIALERRLDLEPLEPDSKCTQDEQARGSDGAAPAQNEIDPEFEATLDVAAQRHSTPPLGSGACAQAGGLVRKYGSARP
jgi:hypothetical protein